MRRTPKVSLTASLAAAVVASLALTSSPAAGSPSALRGAPREVIVVLTEDAGAATSRGAVTRQQDAFLDSAAQAGIEGKDVQTFDTVLNAVAMTVSGRDVGQLEGLPDVAGVFPNERVEAHTEVSVPLIGAPKVWDSEDDPAGNDVRGQGVTVAVIDTGVDYSHPDLGSGFGADHKVVGGYDFANDDADPMDDNGHGTHVAGIIAGDAVSDGGITGVAPDASLLAYKVLGANGNGETVDVLAGIEASVADGADVINMSLGSPGDGTDPVSLASQAAIDAGVVVVSSAGNAGPGAGTVSAPGIVDDVITVGASTSNLVMPVAHLAGDEPALVQTYRGALSANPPTGPVTAELVDVGAGSEADFDAAGDVSDKIVMANAFIAGQPENVFPDAVELAERAEERGAMALIGGQSFGGIGISSEPGVAQVAPHSTEVSPNAFTMPKLVMLGIDNLQYDELARLLDADPVEITISGEDVTDQIASFSSRGPTADLRIKPDLVAPGVEINSTVPKALDPSGQYRFSGTSMAAPHAAGAAALLHQIDPERTPAQIKSALVGTATSLTDAGPNVHGSGRLDVSAAVDAVVSTSTTSLSLGLADLGLSTIREGGVITLTNHGDDVAHLTLSSDDSDLHDVRVPRRVSLDPGETKDVDVDVLARRPGERTDYAGWITVDPSDGSTLTIPYTLYAKPLTVQAQPDPTTGPTTVYVGAPTPLAAAPVVTLDPPRGPKVTLTLSQVNDLWYTAEVDADLAGVYEIEAEGLAASNEELVGSSRFEVLDDAAEGDFQPVGPNSVGGPVTIAPSDPDVAVAAQEDYAGVWFTDDGGDTWTARGGIPVDFPDGQPKVVIDSEDPGLWWVAALDATIGQSQVYRTDDYGLTWELTGYQGDRIQALVANAQTNVLVAVGQNVIHTSSNDGNTWSRVQAGLPGSLLGAAVSGDDLYVHTAREIWKVPGVMSGTPGTAEMAYAGGIFIDDLVADAGFVGAAVWLEGVVGSYDDGATWQNVNDSTRFPDGLFLSDETLFMVDFGNGYQGPNHGQEEWSEFALPSRNAAAYDVEIWADNVMTVSNTAGIYRGPLDGTDYERVGVQGGTTFDLATSGDTLLAGTQNGVYSTDLPVDGPEWGPADGEGFVGASVQHLAVSPDNPDLIWQIQLDAFGGFDVNRSDDGGESWATTSSGSEKAWALEVHPADPDRIIASWERIDGAGLLVSHDRGATWKNLHHDRPFLSVAGDPSDPDVLWLGSPDGLYRSDDGGVTVTKVHNGGVTSILIDGDDVYAGGDGMLVSHDGGRSFREANTSGVSMRVSDIIKVGNRLYASTVDTAADGFAKGARGILQSKNGGRSWHNISGGLPNLNVESLASDGANLYLGTSGSGVFRLPLDR